MAAVATPPKPSDLGLKNLQDAVGAPHTLHKQANPAGSYANVAKSAKEKSYSRMELSFIEPTKRDGIPMIEVPETVIDAVKTRWKHTIVGYVLGYKPSFREMAIFVNTRWAAMGKVRLHNRGNGNFVFEMSSEDARLDVIEKGPWSFSRRPLILRTWEPGQPMDREEIDTLPIWVKFPNLSLDMWTPEGLSLMSSAIGKPLFADRTTSEQSNLAYARVLIEVSGESKFHTEVNLNYRNGMRKVQPILYEWVPDLCTVCKKFGHKSQNCAAKKVYVPKDNLGVTAEIECEVEIQATGKFEGGKLDSKMSGRDENAGAYMIGGDADLCERKGRDAKGMCAGSSEVEQERIQLGRQQTGSRKWGDECEVAEADLEGEAEVETGMNIVQGKGSETGVNSRTSKGKDGAVSVSSVKQKQLLQQNVKGNKSVDGCSLPQTGDSFPGQGNGRERTTLGSWERTEVTAGSRTTVAEHKMVSPMQAVQEGVKPAAVLSYVIDEMVNELRKSKLEPTLEVTPKNTPARSPAPWVTVQRKKGRKSRIDVGSKWHGGAVIGENSYNSLQTVEEDESVQIENDEEKGSGSSDEESVESETEKEEAIAEFKEGIKRIEMESGGKISSKQAAKMVNEVLKGERKLVRMSK